MWYLKIQFMLYSTIILLVLISAISKAVSDTLQHRYEASIFIRFNRQFWDPNRSWQNKWKDNPQMKWSLRSTLFVFLTDAWHLFNFIQYNSFFILLVLISLLNLDLIILIGFVLGLRVLWGIAFEIFWSKVFFKDFKNE